MKDLAVYIHIPFCVKKCNYCDFLSFPAGEELWKKYLEKLIKEIIMTASDCREYIVSSVFLGGGTPSLLDAVCIGDILKALKDNYKMAGDCEITMEMNPGTVTPYKLKLYREYGINRISIGMQSSKDKELKILGRIHNNEEFLKCYWNVREAGFKNVNIDVMSALPAQDYDSYMDTLRQVVSLRPEHISAYSLIIEEGTPFYDMYGEDSDKNKEVAPLPSEEDERKMYHETKRYLRQMGYERYEISNYSLISKDKDYSCRHNKAYWTGIEYIGFGIGAASMMNHTRWSNIRDIVKYMDILDKDSGEGFKALRCDVEELDIHAGMEEFMFLGLRLCKGVSKHKFESLFGQSIQSVYGNVLDKMLKNKLLEEEGDFIKLTEYGTDISNYVMSEFLFD
ncbi:MAG: radical SAM family heme chaperone HemW [Butyrivibrio sp.]|nr:radical SAM family heme chaperone HemW [Butyrivibrio sp.]